MTTYHGKWVGNIMSSADDELVQALGAELVAQLAPEELPLFDSMVKQAAHAKGYRGKAAKDQVLGFGGAEAITMLTPVLMQFSQGFWETLLKQVGDTVADQIVQHLSVRFREKFEKPGKAEKDAKGKKDAIGSAREAKPGVAPADPLAPELTVAAAQRIRKTALLQAERLGLGADQSQLLADAVVGALITPAA